MKPILMLLVALFTTLAAKAQEADYLPFCTEDKTWTVDTDWHFVNGMFRQDKCRLEGDTLIAGKVCKKMYKQTYTSDRFSYRGAFCDDGPRVMYFPAGSDEARLVYDFSLQVGDEASIYSIYDKAYETLRVLSVGNRTCGGRNFRTLRLYGGGEEKGEFFVSWVEGVGSTSSPLDNWSYPALAGMFSVGLRCCTVGGEMFYFDEPEHETMGQEYCEIYGRPYISVPFTQEGKRWAVKHTSFCPEATEHVKEYALLGDTLIAGQMAKRMFEDGSYIGAFFDRGVQTFFIAPGTTTPHLYYNFCARCGEYTRVWHNGAYAQLYACVCGNGWYSLGDSFLQLTKLDIAAFEGCDADYNATYAITDNELTQHYRSMWLEGVGSMEGPMHNWEYPDLDGAPAAQLIACWTPDCVIWDSEDYIEKREVLLQTADCRIWREGSTWEYYDEDGQLTETYTLGAYTKNYDRYYMPLIRNGVSVEGFIRTERGDSLVYARGWRDSGDLLPEVLLYDFTKSYEAGDVMRLGTAKSKTGGCGVDELRIEPQDDAPITFFYDVLEDGDCIPQWNGFIYKFGCLEGPMAYFYNQVSDKKPSAKNLSHLIFGNKKRRGAPAKFFPFGNAYNVFAFDFFNQLCKASDDAEAGGNVVASPLSAQFALSMLQNGAAGNTLREMQFALGTSAYTIDEVNAYNRELIDKLQRPVVLSEEYRSDLEVANEWQEEHGGERVNIGDLLPKMEVANGIWTAPWLPVNEAFFATNAANYDAAAETADFSQQSTMDAIDRWVSDKTHGTIPSVNEVPSDEIAMMLINTLFFRGTWEDPFYVVGDRPFTNADGSRVLVSMMNSEESKERAEDDYFKMVRVAYAPFSDLYEVGRDQVKYRMGLYLPKYDGAVLTTAEWQRLGADAVWGKSNVTMPRFNVANELQLNDVLKAMGMEDAFNKQRADFSALSPMETYVSKVKQLCNITVDERGTTAASATVVVGSTTGMDPSVPFELNIDRPFYFTIETKDGDLLFLGRVCQLDGPPAPAGILDARRGRASAAIYDLAGRRLSDTKNAHGVYVVGGKKVIQ